MPASPLQTTLMLRRRHSRSPGSGSSERLGIGLVGGLLILLTVGLFGLAGLYAYLTADLPALGKVAAYFDPQYGAFYHPTTLLDRTGEHALLTLENPGVPAEYRVLDPDEPNHISPILVQAAISLLQPDFWQSPGFSFQSLLDEKPHTIAERLVNDLMLENEADGARRAMRMRLLAAQLTAEFGRSQVLEWYLNEANFGHLAFGSGAASQVYLQQPADELDLAGAALLIAILDAPALNPLDAPTAALERQQAALLAMRQNGALSEADYEAARQVKLTLRDSLPEPVQMAHAFTRLALVELARSLRQEAIERGGLIIRTTLDYGLQSQIICTLQVQLQRLESSNPGAVPPDECPAARLLPTLNLLQDPVGSDWSASAALLDPQTGQLLALAGDTTPDGESASLVELPAGSLLSPLAAVGLFASGYSPATLVWDIPASLPEELANANNPDGQFHGPERLRNAIANDHLAGLVGLLEQNGAANIWRRVQPLGVEVNGGSQALYGSAALNPLQVAQTYAPLANNGVQVGLEGNGGFEPTLILDVKAGGAPQEGFGSVQTQVLLSPQLAYLVQNVLSDEPARRASLGYPNPLEIGRPAGAKLGQTAEGDDIWAAGFTPQRVIVVRLSRAAGQNQPRLDARLAAGVWHALMQTAMRDLPSLGWSQPAGISSQDVCNPSGLLPTSTCPEVVSEIFLTGNEPTAPDNLFRTLQINRETGLLATVFTPVGLVEDRTYFMFPPQAQAWASQQKLEQPPSAYDLVAIQNSIPGLVITTPAMFAPVSGEVQVRGSAALADMQSYTVQVGQGMYPARWEEIGRGDKIIKNGLLATWQTPQVDGLYAIRLVAVGKDKTVQIAAIQVTVDNTPPTVRLTYPADGAEISLAEVKILNLSAEISDGLGIGQVEWRLDGNILGVQAQEPYSWQWTTRKGKHTLSVEVTDLAGNRSVSSTVEFEVK